MFQNPFNVIATLTNTTCTLLFTIHAITTCFRLLHLPTFGQKQKQRLLASPLTKQLLFMKKLIQVLKWTGIVLLYAGIVLSATVALRQNLKYDAPYPDIIASTDTSIIARGKQLVLGPAHCVNCHGPKNADSLLAKGSGCSLTWRP